MAAIMLFSLLNNLHLLSRTQQKSYKGRYNKIQVAPQVLLHLRF